MSTITGPGIDHATIVTPVSVHAGEEQRSLGTATPITYGELINIFNGGGQTGSGVSVSPRTAMKIATVIACVRVIACGIARMPLVTYARTKEGRSRAWSHPVYGLLKTRPNPEMTAFSLRSTLMVGALLWGNGYAEIVRDRKGQVKSIWPIQSDRVTITRKRDTKELIYRVRTDEGERTLLRHEILHVPGISYDGISGISVIGHAREMLGTAIKADELQGSLMRNSLRPSGALHHPGKLGEKAQANLRESMRLVYGGDNAGTPLILEEGMTWTPFSMSLRDATWMEIANLRVEDICRLFNVPPQKVQHLVAANTRSVEQQSLDFLGDTLAPWVEQLEQEFNWKLFPAEEQGRFYAEHLTQSLIQMDTKARGEMYAMLHRLGALNADEIRARENMNSLEEGRGEVFWVESNKMPMPTPEEAKKLLDGWASKRGTGQPEPKTDDKASQGD